MTVPLQPADSRFAVERATREHQALLFRMLQLYYFEATHWSGEDLLADGLYECDADGVASYCEPDGVDVAYLLTVDGQAAGFVLVELIPFENGQIRELADLFVMPKYRRLGLAEAATRKIVPGHEGPWLFAVFRKDERALRFWQSAFTRLPFRSVQPGPHHELFHQFIINGEAPD
ncbi:putative acetyltransferase [Massilia sp. MP_M2]|uniref:GNAT family N-acetyltransferase n=1 Tax=Massilia sp. MP_M2 TaxID=3071713 RepID=UPI00319DA3AF